MAEMISFQVISHFPSKLTDHGNTWPTSILKYCMYDAYAMFSYTNTVILAMSVLIDIGGHFA